MYGNDYEYAQSRIAKTILNLNNGVPVFIKAVSAGNGDCLVEPLAPKNDEDGQRLVKLNTINFKPPRLGYCNTSGVATYISRVPMRRDWKQGLRRENMFSSLIHITDIPYRDLHKCITGEYPSMIECYNHLTSEKNKQYGRIKSMAFHRHWAMDNKLNILYKHNNIVGRYNYDQHRIDLDEEYHHLFECLQESL